MLQDNRGCRRMLVEWTVGIFVLALSIGALIGFALRQPERPASEVVPPSASEQVLEESETHDGVAERAGSVSDLVDPEVRR